ncbi:MULTISPECIES: Wadjet anti-phage system protein JetD domain-containing protein [Enterobacteriaceae]|uniref:DUF2220 domain-containing protein n=1 Tax=Arsukibacterium indicum TaxID=2848612 RepID=A0ABS6MNC7_9GAMM|nr:hypothetical protein [Escherichia coli]ELR5097719.1 hypothetical protein [Providencia rettgeri]MBV2130311.1 DUF2220 domain-containing protein [Arsukibacterium indicum]MCD1596773.1 DUF2220 domain-containing protein [Rheinheimera aquimaris]HEQ3484987.1 hypothetical protein [Vibrio cholerae]
MSNQCSNPLRRTRELILFRMLRNGTFGCTRLEQERLPIDFVYEKLRLWVG